MISILFLTANPSNLSRLSLDKEFREIREELQKSKLRNHFNLIPMTSIRITDLSKALLDTYPEIVHFSGHGTLAGSLCIEDNERNMQPIMPDALANFFKLFSGHLKGVILNACYSEIQARTIVKHVDYVVGMSHEIGDKAAIAFSIGFYQGLGAGRSFEDAFKFGCTQLELLNLPEHTIPVLIKRKIDKEAKMITEIPASISPYTSFQTQESGMVEFILIMRETGAKFTIRSHKMLDINRTATYLAAKLLPHMMNQGYEWSLEFKGVELSGDQTLLTADICDGDEVFLIGNHKRPKVKPCIDVS